MRAKEAGFEALIVTVDLPVHGHRERDHRNGFAIPPKIGPRQVWHALKAPFWTWDYITSPAIRYANLSEDTAAVSLATFVGQQLDPSFDWDDAAALIADWEGPTILKGIVHPDDAMRAKRIGFTGVTVSNHGGRQLERDIAPLDALPAVRVAVGSDYTVLIDGGVRRGGDILTALMLGADAVGLGRSYLYGLAADGEDGVAKAIELLQSKLMRSMALAGLPNLTRESLNSFLT